jgi:hypothetical protein
MRPPRAVITAVVSLGFAFVAACGSKTNGGDDVTGDGGGGPPDACVGLQCAKVNCMGQGIGTTRLSGTVFAPNGTLPLFGATVYVPNSDPGPLVDGVTCSRCNDQLPGNPVVQTTTDELGHFNLDDVPVADNLPVVVQIGKWRRQFTIPKPDQCADTPLAPTLTRLPSKKSEGDMPRIAITTGSADALDCFVRKIGIDDSEISNDAGPGRVHLYSGNGANKFAATFANTGNFTDATALWSNLNKLKNYDILILSCEGAWPSDRGTQANPTAPGSNTPPADNNTVTPLAARKAIFDYANLGGRVFASHWHNMWLEYAPAPWPSIATFQADRGDNSFTTTVGTVNKNFDRGKSLYNWLDGPVVKGLNAQKLLDIKEGRNTCTNNDAAKSDKYVFLDPQTAADGADGPQDLLFTTPNDVQPTDRCGKVVFSDMHVSATSTSKAGTPYPGTSGQTPPAGCDTGPLTPQEKALAFIFFDIASCVGPVVN